VLDAQSTSTVRESMALAQARYPAKPFVVGVFEREVLPLQTRAAPGTN
jgi:hypothetical protein